MMNLAEHEKRFLAKRQQLARVYPWVGATLLGVIIVFAAWLVWRVPLLVNPYAVLAQLRDGGLPDSMLSLMAGMLPLAVLACLLFALALVALLFAAFANERRYLSIIRRARALDNAHKE